MILEYHKTRDGVISPTRANPSDAGLDIYFNPKPGADSPVTLKPGDTALFSTGLKFGVPHGYMLEVKNRSGNASKRSLLVGACVIDSGYDGEVFVNLHNVGSTTQVIESGMKIAQVVLIPVVHFRLLESNADDLYEYPITISGRGSNALGSTDASPAKQAVDVYDIPKNWELGDPPWQS